jgi:hypothetical protein
MDQRIGFAREVSALKTRILASIGIWLAAVVTVAGIAWLAINTAGRQVTAAPISAPIGTRLPATPSGSALLSPVPSATPTVPKSTSTRSSPPIRPTRTATAKPKNTTGSDPTWTGPATITGMFSTTAGRVKVNCTGRQISLAGGYAQPAPGWSVRVQSDGPRQVQVLFQIHNQQAVVVFAHCSGGRPQFDQDRIGGGAPTTGSGDDGQPVG